MRFFKRQRTEEPPSPPQPVEGDHLALVAAIVSEVAAGGHQWPSADEVRSAAGWPALAAAPQEVRVAAAVEALARSADPRLKRDYRRLTTLVVIGQELLRSKLPLTADDRVALLRSLLEFAARGGGEPRLFATYDHTRSVLRALERGGDVARLPVEDDLLRQVRTALIAGDTADAKRCVPRVDSLLGVGADDTLFANPDWCAQALLDGLEGMPDDRRPAGLALLQLAVTVSASRPTAAYLERAAALASTHDQHAASALGELLRAAALPVTPQRGQVDPITGDALRGLCWAAAALPPTPELAAAVGGWVTQGWVKVPGLGPRCRKAASGAVWALARLGEPGAAQLGRTRALVKQPQAVAEVDAAIAAAADELGIPREEFEERVVPSYDLEIGAVRTVPLGDFVATLRFEQGKPVIAIAGPDGKVRKTVPAAVRQDHAAALAELKALGKDVSSMITAQKLRLERLLMEERSWEAPAWRERYLDHPLVSAVARPLIWELDPEGRRTPFLAADGQPRGVDGEALTLGAEDRVGLWHPATAPTAEAQAWRRRVEDLGVVQPFKQAHREVYLLTDAERTTDIYSNRFAGHILRQHQFAALARSRGWRYALQGAWDQPDEQATLRLAQHGVEAGFWVDRPWDADNDWNDMGVFNHVLTDQVRVTTLDGDTVHLADVPVRLLSEILRDVDLFVGVSSIGNDPSWQDSGDARQRAWGDYWTSYSFGELTAAAQVRRDLLARLIPKLAIRDVATLDEKFLVVKGSLRTYKIHLGSGNIMMEPNDQYLCIVPGRGDDGPRDVMLPFEGDRLLSIVLSKAMLLANDAAITDRTITSQINRR